jgi:hypothetical protein
MSPFRAPFTYVRTRDLFAAQRVILESDDDPLHAKSRAATRLPAALPLSVTLRKIFDIRCIGVVGKTRRTITRFGAESIFAKVEKRAQLIEIAASDDDSR